MKRIFRLTALAALLYACLAAAASAEGEPAEVRCDERQFTVGVPAGYSARPCTYEDEWDTVYAGGVVLAADDAPTEIRVIRRDRFYNVYYYLGGAFEYALEERGSPETEGIGIYRTGGRALYGNAATVTGETTYREIRLIPVSDNRGTEFAVRFAPEDEASALAALDTVIRTYRPDAEPEEPEAQFLPVSRREEPDLRNGRYLIRIEDADKIETDGYFTAVLYEKDYYPAEDVYAMRPGDTILIQDRVLMIEEIEPTGILDDGSWYEAELTAADGMTGTRYCFTLTLTEDGAAFWPYFGNDCHSATRAGTVRVQTGQAGKIRYYEQDDEEDYLYTDDLLSRWMNDPETDPAMSGAGWNEYTHACTFEDGRPVRIDTWPYPYNPEDIFAE